MNRRELVALIGAAAASGMALRAVPGWAAGPFRMGLTPVFLDNDATLLKVLGAALSEALGRDVEFEQRRTYTDVTGLLLQGAVDAAWLCGFPYLKHKDELDVVAVPLWQGRPLYRSYLIVSQGDGAQSLADLRGSVHAFSDPESNSGYLVTATDLIRMGETPTRFFSRSIFTYGHRNVVRAVAAGLTRSGSVDGYVWEALALREPDLTRRTRVISRSEWLGFPPICARRDRMSEPGIAAFREALLTLDRLASGVQALDLLELDGLSAPRPGLYDGIAMRMRDLERLR